MGWQRVLSLSTACLSSEMRSLTTANQPIGDEMSSDLWVFWDELRLILREFSEMSSDFERIFWSWSMNKNELSLLYFNFGLYFKGWKFWDILYQRSKVVIGGVEKCLNLVLKLALEVILIDYSKGCIGLFRGFE